ncbi:hypothetical protein P0W64_04400 [Tsukamurella sp. 8F]|uniref:hypothetical protein n=1 Tax=unclassified Tsukamurella TaxID=2633480 RepID=UPI0023B95507|nr:MULTISPECIES: hypothetical protein [unclassified Tsukamurella]MDF0529729.1 hypothetical protein [Tsukamurella sp. 8J]MDF0586014.1 hypothetical protein [Tsukamurella sp. 8F]
MGFDAFVQLLRVVRNVLMWVFVMALGIFLLADGISDLRDKGAPNCGGVTMSTGDVCHYTRDGRPVGDDDSEQVAAGHKGAAKVFIGIGAGLVLADVLVGGVTLSEWVKKR